MPDDLEIGQSVDVWSRNASAHEPGAVPVSCNLVGFADKANQIILVDDGQSIRLAQWESFDVGFRF